MLMLIVSAASIALPLAGANPFFHQSSSLVEGIGEEYRPTASHRELDRDL